MKRKSILALVLILIIALSACTASGNAEAPSPTPSQSASPSPTPSQPVTYTVKTDYSGLTPYKPMEEVYTRLTEDYMPELIPSDDYGPLLPYVGEVLYDVDGYTIGERYGLVTMNGMMVTDAVFSHAFRLWEQDHYIYLLAQPPETMTSSEKTEQRYALCSSDGSWITPFSYCDYLIFDKVILLIRNYATNDIDVYAYNGTFLYNLKVQSYYQEIQLSYFQISDNDHFIYYGEGYFSVMTNDNKVAFIEELSGGVVFTDYSEARGFNDGYAAVKINDLWGFIDNNFNLIIKPMYRYVGDFEYGKVEVGLANENDAVIDSENNILLQGEKINYYGGLFEVENGDRTFYDYKLNKLNSYGKFIEPFYSDYSGPDISIWYANNNNGNLIMYNNGKEIKFPNMMQPIAIYNNLIICSAVNYIYGHALYTTDGKVIIPMMPGVNISFGIDSNEKLRYMLINKTNSDAFTVLDTSYNELFSGSGEAVFNSNFNLFRISDDRFFAYMDTSGKYIFKISLQDNIPD